MQVVGGTFTLRNACLRTAESYGLARREATTAQAQANRAAKELAFIRSRKAAKTKELQATKEASRWLEAWLMEAKKGARAKKERTWAAKLKLDEATMKVASLKLQLEGVSLRATEAEALAQGAVEEAECSKEEASSAKAQVARDKAARAVELYKSSTNFVNEVTEAAYDAILKGFEECKDKVAWAFNITNLDNITVKDLEELARH